MAEGRGINVAERSKTVLDGLEAFGKAVDKLKQIGLTHKAAVIQAGKMFDLDLNEEDITDEPPAGDGQSKLRAA